MGQSWTLDDRGNLIYRGQTISRVESGAFAFWDAIVGLDLHSPERLDTILYLDYPAPDLGSPGSIRVPLVVNSPFWDRLPDGRIAWSSLDRDHVRIHGPGGALLRIVSSDAWLRRPASDADGEALRELLRDKLTSLGGVAEAADGPNVVFPDSLPVCARWPLWCTASPDQPTSRCLGCLGDGAHLSRGRRAARRGITWRRLG